MGAAQAVACLTHPTAPPSPHARPQSQARAGLATSVTSLEAETNKLGQDSSDIRATLAQPSMQAAVQEAASGTPHEGHDAAREAYSMTQVRADV